MKKIFLIIINVFMFCVSDAQVYLGLQSSYNMSMNGRTIADYLLVDGSFSSITSDNKFIDKRSSFGGGLKLGALLGFKINQYMGVELNSNFHHTNKITARSTEGINSTNVSLNGKIISVNPALVAYFYDGSPKVYSKFGVVYNMGKFIYNFNQKTNSEQESYTFNINKGYALGLTFSVGVDWIIKKNISMRTELSYISANYYPKRASLVKYEINGQNQMTSINPIDYEIYYAKEAYTDGEYYGSALGRGTLLRPQIPMNGLGFNLGFIFSLLK